LVLQGPYEENKGHSSLAHKAVLLIDDWNIKNTTPAGASLILLGFGFRRSKKFNLKLDSIGVCRGQKMQKLSIWPT